MFDDRRRILKVGGATLAGLIGLAGCSTEDEPEAVDDDTPADSEETNADDDGDSSGSGDAGDGSETREVDAAVGELVEGDNIHLVVENVERDADLGEFFDPDQGNVFVAVDLAMKNVSNDYLSVSNLLQTRVQDDEGYSYDQTFVGDADASFNGGQFAPGEVERGQIAYEIPEDASGLELRFDFDVGIIGSVERAYIDLESGGGGVSLEQDLQVDVYDTGQNVAFDDVAVTVNEVRFESELSQFNEADQGNEFAIVDIAVTNDTGEDHRVSTILQMQVKDGDGRSYQEDLMGSSDLDRPFDEGSPIADGETRRGELAYQVPEDASPLYWVFEFSVWVEGNKTFWQVA